MLRPQAASSKLSQLLRIAIAVGLLTSVTLRITLKYDSFFPP